MRIVRIFVTIISISLLAACASKQPLSKLTSSKYPTTEQHVAGCAPNEQKFDCDRRAILAMLGEYQVTFNFDETVVLKPAYQRKEPKRSNAFETVILLEDTEKFISLQHILVTESGDIVKHWRQDWLYESPKHWTYLGDQRFEMQTRDAAEISGSWTQLVYNVNDEPRYTGSGNWNHKYGVSTWTSERSWRPLPRREYTTRNDYQLINGENRHTITPQGWTHEQDNTKVIRNEENSDSVLTREFGFNEYRRIADFNFDPAYSYWKSTSAFWAAVRAHWSNEFSTKGSVTLASPIGDEELINTLFELADEYKEVPELDAHQAALKDAFQELVNVENRSNH